MKKLMQKGKKYYYYFGTSDLKLPKDHCFKKYTGFKTYTFYICSKKLSNKELKEYQFEKQENSYDYINWG